jgi:hypothetical protein
MSQPIINEVALEAAPADAPLVPAPLVPAPLVPAPLVPAPPVPSVELNCTFTHQIANYAFGDLSTEMVQSILKDGRVFSHFIEMWLEQNYPLTHVSGCKSHDFTDRHTPAILYDEKTFTSGGCRFCPSGMIGKGRKFKAEEFKEKSQNLIYCIVSNVNFPEIKIRFVRGAELAQMYPNATIPLKDHIKFFD